MNTSSQAGTKVAWLGRRKAKQIVGATSAVTMIILPDSVDSGGLFSHRQKNLACIFYLFLRLRRLDGGIRNTPRKN